MHFIQNKCYIRFESLEIHKTPTSEIDVPDKVEVIV